MENNKCSHCKGTGKNQTYHNGCDSCNGDGKNHYDGDLLCDCCDKLMGYIGHDCDMNGNMFICIQCKNNGAYIVRTRNDRGGIDLSFKLP